MTAFIEFIDPETGESYRVKPAKTTVELAYRLGYLPLTGEDRDRADAVDEPAFDEENDRA